MSTTRDLVVITSLAPGADHARQHAALSSWWSAGLACCSVNTEAEQEMLRDHFPDLEFLSPPRTAESAAGKPVPYIHDMLTLAYTRFPDAKAYGIINDDILIRSEYPFDAHVAERAENTMILGPRVDIAALEDASAYSESSEVTFSVGYDLIFVPRDRIPAIPPAPLAMGMPFWDYWLPITAILQGWSLEVISDQALLHVRHETVWDDTVFVFFHSLASAVLQGLQTRKSEGQTHFALAVDLLTQVYNDAFETATADQANAAQRENLSRVYDRFQEVIVHYIKAEAKPMTLRFNDA